MTSATGKAALAVGQYSPAKAASGFVSSDTAANKTAAAAAGGCTGNGGGGDVNTQAATAAAGVGLGGRAGAARGPGHLGNSYGSRAIVLQQRCIATLGEECFHRVHDYLSGMRASGKQMEKQVLHCAFGSEPAYTFGHCLLYCSGMLESMLQTLTGRKVSSSVADSQEPRLQSVWLISSLDS
jgi:hypothetical protein